MSVLHDFRYAVRQLLRTPGFTAAAVITLALGIGVNTAFFAAVNAVVFRPVRAFDTQNVWRPELNSAAWRNLGLPFDHFRALENDLPAGIAAIDARIEGPVLAHIPGRAERVDAEYVSGGHAEVFGLLPQAGRFITRDEDRGKQRTLVISDRLWREWYAGDRSIVGRNFIRINNDPFLIVGVAPFGYRGRSGFHIGNTDIWMPISTVFGARRASSDPPILTSFATTAVRLAPGVSREQAAQEIATVIKPRPMPPNRPEPYVVALNSVGSGSNLERPAYLLLTFSAFILLAACANLANMLYTRGAHRAAEVAVRQSLGASGGRIFRQFFAEACLIALTASALGLTLALSATQLLQRAFPVFRDRATRISIDLTPDYRVFVWAFGAGVAATLAVGVITAWQASRVSPLRAMATGDAATSITRTSRRVRLGLVAIQVTGAVVLLMGAGLYLRNTRSVFAHRVTFDTKPVATARIELGKHGYNGPRSLAFLRRLHNDVRAIEGIEAAAISDGVPAGVSMGGTGAVLVASKPGVPEPRYIDGSYRRAGGFIVAASAGFLSTLDLSIEAGRDLNEGDKDGSPLVVVISRNAANKLFGDADPIGRRLMLGNDGRWRTIVGVCADPVVPKPLGPRELVQHATLALVPLEQRFQPALALTEDRTRYTEQFRREKLIVFRSPNVRGHLDALRTAVRNIDPEVAVYDAAPVDDSILSWVGPQRAARLIMITLAVIALAIAVVGIYGVLAFIVARRQREFGIRIALGAARRQVLKMVFDDALHLLLVGLLAGVFVTAVSERALTTRRLLPPNEISMWVVVPLLILTVGLVAALIPARRAASVDPNVALRDL